MRLASVSLTSSSILEHEHVWIVKNRHNWNEGVEALNACEDGLSAACLTSPAAKFYPPSADLVSPAQPAVFREERIPPGER